MEGERRSGEEEKTKKKGDSQGRRDEHEGKWRGRGGIEKCIGREGQASWRWWPWMCVFSLFTSSFPPFLPTFHPLHSLWESEGSCCAWWPIEGERKTVFHGGRVDRRKRERVGMLLMVTLSFFKKKPGDEGCPSSFCLFFWSFVLLPSLFIHSIPLLLHAQYTIITDYYPCQLLISLFPFVHRFRDYPAALSIVPFVCVTHYHYPSWT